MTKEIIFVTSFSKEGYEQYAKNMLESADKFLSEGTSLVAYYHDFSDADVDKLPTYNRISFRNLNDDSEMLQYRAAMKSNGFDGTFGGKQPYNWRVDAIKWCHKVFALTGFMENHISNLKKSNYVCWIDADTIFTKKVEADDFIKNVITTSDVDSASLTYLGRTAADYAETSFMCFDTMHKTDVRDFLKKLRSIYVNKEVTSFREWHDGFIIERLISMGEAMGDIYTRNLTPHCKDLDAFGVSPVAKYMKHFKGNLKNNPQNLPTDKVAKDVKLPRYKQLSDLVRTYGSSPIVEIGTWNGGRAVEMALAYFEKNDKLHYVGYDLFEEATEDTDAYELNTKPHNSVVAVEKRLNDFAAAMKEKGKEFTFKLVKGDTRKTLKLPYDVPKTDFVFIDGGHSEETVRNDYEAFKNSKVIVFDDYFSKDQEGKEQPEEFLGTNRLFKEIAEDQKKKSTMKYVMVLPSQDRVVSGGITHLAVLVQDKTLPDMPKDLMKHPVIIKPRDSMPKKYIAESINYNNKLITNWGFVRENKMHNEEAIIVSAGPSLDLDEVKAKIAETNGTVICVKHSYPKLIEAGIQPDFCVVLDPREITGKSTHGIVRKSLFAKPLRKDKKTKFLVASMTDRSVTEYLLKAAGKKRVWGWHAYSEAIKDGLNGTPVDGVKLDFSGQQDITFVTGGTCSATRSIGIFHVLGFRTFHLFGFDGSVNFEPTKKQREEKVENGNPKYMKVELNDVYFWTTGELLALAQDMERMFADKEREMNLYVYGENSLIKQAYEGSYASNHTDWRDGFNTALRYKIGA